MLKAEIDPPLKTWTAQVVGLVLLAYADKFNLPIFFLRLLAYIYARHGLKFKLFMQGRCGALLMLDTSVLEPVRVKFVV